MARLAFGLAGAAIGSVVPGVGTSWGWTIGSLLGGALFPEQLPDIQQQGPRLNDLTVQSSAYGAMVPWVRGTIRLGGNIIWAKPLREVVTTTSEEQGGKGGPSQTVTTTTYQYYATFAIAYCEGDLAALARLWINGALEYDQRVTANAGTVALSSEKWSGKLRFYSGSETQVVDSAIEDHEGVGMSSAYRGTAYLVFEDLDVTANHIIPIIEAEFVQSGTTGDVITSYVNTDLSTPETQDVRAAEYLGPLGEVWHVDVSHGTGSPSGPARFGVLNLATQAWSYVYFPTDPIGGLTWWISAVGGTNYPGTIWVEEWDTIFTVARALEAGAPRTTVAFSASARSCVGAFAASPIVSARYAGLDGTWVIAVDVERNHAVWSTGNKTQILRLNSARLPGVELYWRDDGTHGSSQEVGFFGLDGTFCLLVTDGYLSFAYDGEFSASTFAATGSDGRTVGGTELNATDRTRGVNYYWSAPDGAGDAYLMQVTAAGVQSRITPTRMPGGSSSEPALQSISYSPEMDKIVVFAQNRLSDGGVWLVEPSDGSYTQAAVLPQSSHHFFCDEFAVSANVLWSMGGNVGGASKALAEVRFDALTIIDPTLISVREALNAEVGITAAQLDSTDLAGITVRGYAVARVGTARAAEEALMMRYNYDVVESGGTLKAVRRGGATAHAFSADDLGVS